MLCKRTHGNLESVSNPLPADRTCMQPTDLHKIHDVASFVGSMSKRCCQHGRGQASEGPFFSATFFFSLGKIFSVHLSSLASELRL